MPSETGYVPPARSSTYPVRAGNFVRPLVDGVPAFRRICETVEAAERSVWVTVAFVDRFLSLPDGHGTFFDVLDRAVARGLDVRVVFWREPSLDPPPGPGWEIFTGNTVERAWLAERGSRFFARWDHLPDGCHHQKSWVVDAGGPREVAFVGGINLDRMSMVEPGHRSPTDLEHYHDVYLEIAGPSASDVHHNFVQRWNEASERGRSDGVWGSAGDLAYPSVVSAARGDSVTQVVRTLRDREKSVLESYVGAIDAAREWIYVENQFFFSHPIFERLDAALRRGVEVVVVVPGRPLPEVYEARKRHPRLFAALEALGRHERFTLAALVATDGDGTRRDVYVHAKMAIVDGVWMTVGSANLEKQSLERATELNIVCWDSAIVAALWHDLVAEHLVGEARAPRGASAMRDLARSNGASPGLPVQIDPASYAV
jgi:phosphatidylserine/phosphatidylglycerophosphate/cardiolipin synthase-like enzyme